jgi:hypothetical protein
MDYGAHFRTNSPERSGGSKHRSRRWRELLKTSSLQSSTQEAHSPPRSARRERAPPDGEPLPRARIISVVRGNGKTRGDLPLVQAAAEHSNRGAHHSAPLDYLSHANPSRASHAPWLKAHEHPTASCIAVLTRHTAVSGKNPVRIVRLERAA